MRQGYSSVPATNTMIRRMIKETDGDHFEDLRSLEQNLTFQAAKKEFEQCKVTFGVPQMKTLGIMNQEGIYTNWVFCCQINVCIRLRQQFLREQLKMNLKIEENLPGPCLNR